MKSILGGYRLKTTCAGPESSCECWLGPRSTLQNTPDDYIEGLGAGRDKAGPDGASEAPELKPFEAMARYLSRM